jgi:hypothetical protein
MRLRSDLAPRERLPDPRGEREYREVTLFFITFSGPRTHVSEADPVCIGGTLEVLVK